MSTDLWQKTTIYQCFLCTHIHVFRIVNKNAIYTLKKAHNYCILKIFIQKIIFIPPTMLFCFLSLQLSIHDCYFLTSIQKLYKKESAEALSSYYLSLVTIRSSTISSGFFSTTLILR